MNLESTINNPSPSDLSLLAYRYLQKRDFLLAINAALKALEKDPSLVDTWLNLASAYFNVSHFKKACFALEKGLKLDPRHINMLVLAAGALAKTGNYGEAIERCRQVLAIHPRHALALSHQAHCYNKLGEYERAIQPALEALKIEPDSSHSWLELGLAQLYLDEPGTALESFQKGLALEPCHVDLLSNSAMALACLGKTDEAVQMNKKVFTLNPHHESALNNQAKLFCDLGLYEEGIGLFKKILKCNPNHWEVIWNLSLVYLLLGDLETGLDLYQHRLKADSIYRQLPKLDSPEWQGEPIEGKTLLLRCEQGYGDTIQFLRYVPCLLSYGCHVVIEMPPELHGLFEHLGVHLIGKTSHTPVHDVQARLLSLMHLLPARLQMIPPPVSIAKTALRPIKGRIGLVWRGNPKHKKDRQRSLNVAQLEPLLRLEGMSFISLQQNLTEPEKQYLSAHQVEMPALESWRDTVNILETCEKVLSVDTAVAHLAASMQVPTWIFLPYVPDWRWRLEKSDTPWYSAVQLFRQEKLDSWKEPIEKAKEQLLQRAALC